MFSVALAGMSAASPWFDVHRIPQDLIEGIIATFIGLSILFSIKPRLKIELLPVGRKASTKTSDDGGDQRPGKPTDDPRSETFKFTVTNRRLRKVIEIRARLWRIPRGELRQPIDLVINELFELRGNWSPLKPARSSLLRTYLKRLSLNGSHRKNAKKDIGKLREVRKDDKKYRPQYTFYPGRGKLEEERGKLREGDFILFQVIAKDSFTGFTRLKTKRFYEDALKKVASQAASGRPHSPASGRDSPTASN